MVWYCLSLGKAKDCSLFPFTLILGVETTPVGPERPGGEGIAERLLLDTETDVKKATSFAIRLAARGDPAPVRDMLARNVPPQDPVATWVLCDAIRSMARKLLPEFAYLLPQYQAWASDPTTDSRDRRSIESAVKTLHKVAR